MIISLLFFVVSLEQSNPLRFRQSQITREINSKVLFVKHSVALSLEAAPLPKKFQEVLVELHCSWCGNDGLCEQSFIADPMLQISGEGTRCAMTTNQIKETGT